MHVMASYVSSLPRREFLRQACGAIAGVSLPLQAHVAGEDDRSSDRPKVAAVVTEFTYRSHAHVILENFLNPYLFNGEVTDPGVDVVSLYVDQFPNRDMGRAAAKERDIPIYPTIAEALRRGGKDLAVDAVLSIGEHGN